MPIDFRSGNVRGIAEYAKDVIFSDGLRVYASGKPRAGRKKLRTTVLDHEAGLRMLEGFPQPGRHWF